MFRAERACGRRIARRCESRGHSPVSALGRPPLGSGVRQSFSRQTLCDIYGGFQHRRPFPHPAFAVTTTTTRRPARVVLPASSRLPSRRPARRTRRARTPPRPRTADAAHTGRPRSLSGPGGFRACETHDGRFGLGADGTPDIGTWFSSLRLPRGPSSYRGSRGYAGTLRISAGVTARQFGGKRFPTDLCR